MNKTILRISTMLLFLLSVAPVSYGQDHSVAREWNDILLESIRESDARPTVHARNLYHISLGMYEAFAAFDESSEQLFLGKTLGDYFCEYDGIILQDQYTIEQAQEIALSYAAYRLMKHRYQNSNGFPLINYYLDAQMFELELDGGLTSVDYSDGTPHSLGNYIAQEIINYGFTDNANEENDYANEYYTTVNDTLFMNNDGNPNLLDPNRWQPLGFNLFIGQAGDTLNGSPDFLSPEWGWVEPFAMTEEDAVVYNRDGFDWKVYHDPGDPAYLDTETATDIEDFYKWNHSLVSVWSAHLDPTDGVLIDASPNATGNIPLDELPTTMEEYQEFYDYMNGGDASHGYEVNPYTGEPYEPQFVPRGDYGRVLAEFWADGPDSETPPGHWFTLLNEVNENELLEKKWQGKGDVLSDLEWDVKTYLTLGGAVHDAAISAWGIKGYYDYIRPVSAIRWMADNGQSTDPDLPSYDINGIPLVPGKIELVSDIDPLAGEFGENVGKIKLMAWKGPDYINNPNVDEAGVDWILSEDWWPYQRPTFVTPPFAGYVSGHSTFSRAAAEVMTMMTGSEYFPGGLGVFEAPMNSFLVFEDGPSQDIEFQWATYQDASDQCSLSRIWGGIHPPIDDIPGRLIGYEIGHDAFAFANDLFDNEGPRVSSIEVDNILINTDMIGTEYMVSVYFNELVDTMMTPTFTYVNDDPLMNSLTLSDEYWADCDQYVLIYTVNDGMETLTDIDLEVSPMTDPLGNVGFPYLEDNLFQIDLEMAGITSVLPIPSTITDALIGDNAFSLTITFDEMMNIGSTPALDFPMEDPWMNTLEWDEDASFWSDAMTYVAVFDVTDGNISLDDIDVELNNAVDGSGNTSDALMAMDNFNVDTENPMITSVIDADMITDEDEGSLGFSIEVVFSEEMDPTSTPMITFPGEDPEANTLVFESGAWNTDNESYSAVYTVNDANEELENIDVMVASALDMNGNMQEDATVMDEFSIDTKNPGVLVLNANTYVVTNDDDSFTMLVIFDEDMNMDVIPTFSFPVENPSVLFINEGESGWINNNTFEVVYSIDDEEFVLEDIDVLIEGAEDAAGNIQNEIVFEDYFDINTTVVSVEELAQAFEGTLLYPNPVGQGQELIIDLAKNFTELTYEIYDLNGRLVAHQQVTDVAEQISVSTDGWSKGMYLVNLYSQEGRATFKVNVK